MQRTSWRTANPPWWVHTVTPPRQTFLHVLLLFLIASSFGACSTTNENAARREIRSHQHTFNRTSNSQTNTDNEKSTLDGTLGSYISYAMKNSAELEAQFERWQTSIYRIAQTRKLPDPVVSYAFYIRNVETRVGPQRHRLGLKQSFPWPTKLSAGADAAAAKARFEQQKFDATAIAIQHRIAQQYWSIWQLKESQKIHKEHLVLLQGLSESAQGLLMTGRIELAELQQIDLTAARVNDLLFAIDEKIVQHESALKGIISAPHSFPVHIVSAPNIDIKDIDEPQLLAAARSHPFIESFEELANAGKANARREDASRYPSFSLGVDWIETGDAQSPGVPESGKDAVLVGVGIAIPLWQRNYNESIAAHKSEVRAHLAQKQAAQDAAQARFYESLSKLRDTQRRIGLYNNTLVPQATSVFDSVLGAYVSGKSNIASILLAERDLLDLRIQLIEAHAEYAKQWAVLENIVGRSIDATSIDATADRSQQQSGQEK